MSSSSATPTGGAVPKPEVGGPPSMEMVASLAGVATSTVSRALKGDPRISRATRERVRAVTEQLGYRPNPLVTALMTQIRHAHPPVAACNLAWLDFFPGADDWRADPVQRAFYTGGCAQAELIGYVISRVRANDRPAPRLARMLRDRGIRGVLLPAVDELEGVATKIPLPLDEFTVVSVGTRFERPALHYSSDDQYECGRLAVQKLWELGYRKIGYVGEPRVEKIVNGRFFAGYSATLQSELGGSVLPPLLTSNDDDIVGWARGTRVDAVVSANRRIWNVLRRAGVRLPDEIALAHLNIDDVEGAQPGDVAGVRQDNAGVGGNAVELLVNLLYRNEVGVPLHPRGVQVHGTWVHGATVRRV